MESRPEQQELNRTDAALALMIGQVARSANADAVICGTETGALFRKLVEHTEGLRMIAATPNIDTYETLVGYGFEAVRLSLRVANKYGQARHGVSTALNAGAISVGDLVVCAIGHDLCHGVGDLVLVTDVEANVSNVALSEMIKLTDGIRPSVLESALRLACKIGDVAQRGKRVGALFVLGDSENVLERSRQLVLNPFQGHGDQERMLTDPRIDEMLIELSKLDGAFIVRGDGLIRTAAAFLATSEVDVTVPVGLGARHVAAAAVTAQTEATAVVVSATDGFVRAFSGGELVLQMDPAVPLGPFWQPPA